MHNSDLKPPAPAAQPASKKIWAAVLGRASISLASLLSAFLLARFVDIDTNGVLFFLLSVGSISITIGSLGLNAYIVGEAQKNTGDVNLVSMQLSFALTLIPALTFILSLLILLLWPWRLGGVGFLTNVLFSALAALIAAQIYLGDALRGFHRYSKFQLISSGSQVVAITATGIVGTYIVLLYIVTYSVLIKRPTIEDIVGGSILISLACNFMALKEVGKVCRLPLIPTRQVISKNLKEALPLLVSSVGFSLFAILDVIFLKLINATNREVAIYSIALRLVTLIHIPQAFLISYFQPMMARHFYANKFSALTSSCLRITRFTVPVGAFVLIVYVFFGKAILREIFGHEYIAGAEILWIRGASYMFLLVAGVSGGLLLVTGHAATVARHTLLAISISLFLLLFLNFIDLLSPVYSVAISVTVGHIYQSIALWRKSFHVIHSRIDFFEILGDRSR